MSVTIAFPSKNKEGMTLLDYFAAKAMQSTLTHSDIANGDGAKQHSEFAYKMGAAMLAERSKHL